MPSDRNGFRKSRQSWILLILRSAERPNSPVMQINPNDLYERTCLGPFLIERITLYGFPLLSKSLQNARILKLTHFGILALETILIRFRPKSSLSGQKRGFLQSGFPGCTHPRFQNGPIFVM